MHKQNVSLSQIDLNDPQLRARVASKVLKEMEKNPGMTLKEATGISDEALEEVYSLAYTFYNQGKYFESVSLFEFLTGSSPSTYKYVLGLAASYHQIQAFNEAFAGFILALHIDPTQPVAAYYAMDCCLKEGLNEDALELAEATCDLCEGRLEYAALQQRCMLIARSLRQGI